MIYLDNAATTRPLDTLGELASRHLDEWHNPSALYAPGVEARENHESRRRQLEKAFSSGLHRCVFTSGGTESANMVICAGVSRRRDANIVIGGFEHPCVEESAKHAWGAQTRRATCDGGGLVRPESVLEQMDERTALVCVMHVNNETGARNDIARIAAAVKRKNPRALFFADGVQAFMREDLPDASQIDYYSASAHKIHGLKGVGCLFYLPSAPLKPFMQGGGQESGLRSGTENTLGVLAFSEAVRFFSENATGRRQRVESLFDILAEEISAIEDAVLITPEDKHERCSHILCASFAGVRGETLMHCLEREGVIVSTGSACSSKKRGGRMEKALGLSPDVAQGAVRLSLGAFTTEDETRAAAEEIRRQVTKLRAVMRKS